MSVAVLENCTKGVAIDFEHVVELHDPRVVQRLVNIIFSQCVSVTRKITLEHYILECTHTVFIKTCRNKFNKLYKGVITYNIIKIRRSYQKNDDKLTIKLRICY